MLRYVTPASAAGVAPPVGVAALPTYPTFVVAETAPPAVAARVARGSPFVIGRSEHDVTEFVTRPTTRSLLGRTWEPTLILCPPPRGAAAGVPFTGVSLMLKDYFKPEDPGTLFCVSVAEAASAKAAGGKRGGDGDATASEDEESSA